ncbi:MAG: hypothetical protein KJ795_07720 [Gammaproteobacteria bacterium]|nr:hypothetical protein [Gammaproteobacteria bacterium]MBU1777494.1 hypothetical protein [Gammaproteobacteria bacterium]MBU1969875.1 hypothetical protein [Gammaproteobacteria bacterium]
MTIIPDFSESEQKHVAAILFERYGKFIPMQLADSELQLGGDTAELTDCPTLYWNERGAHFIVCKVAAGRFRCQFFYSEAEQYGTGKDDYENLEECVSTLLQVQSDHERQLVNVSTGATATTHDGEYHGSSMV